MPKKKKSPVKKSATNHSPTKVGNKVFIRTVTHFFTGLIVALTKETISLKDCAWIADTGRFGEALRTGNLNEIEPYPDGVIVDVSRGAVIDTSTWNHALPRSAK